MRTLVRTYLDHAAAAPVSKRAHRAFLLALKAYGNPGAPHTEGRGAKDILENARECVARLAGVRSDAVIFTGGATEANNLAILGSVSAGQHVLVAEGAHASITEPLKALRERGIVVETVPFTDGALDMGVIRTLLRPETRLVCVERVASETGVMTDTRDVRRALDKAGGGSVLLHVDASQSPRIDSIERTHLGADMLVLDAQKVGGVRGIGALIHSPRVTLNPLLYGGSQESGYRPGTPSPALASAFAEALIESAEERASFLTHAQTLRARILNKLPPNTVVNEGKQQAPHILNLSFITRDTDYLAALLDEAGFAVSTRSACETDAEGSRGVLALTHDETRARSSLRISFGPETSRGEITRFLKALSASVEFIDQHRL